MNDRAQHNIPPPTSLDLAAVMNIYEAQRPMMPSAASGGVRQRGGLIDILDEFDGLKTSIFYINSNDGYTEFEDGTKVESVANRLVTFPHHMKHRGTTCTNQPFRLVINFNYL